ncbi:PAAR domain-containing protein [Burkholderia sp. AU31624]|uniref:PAAR domain-containing protein n=1 Tax=Burkholderia sp. AU31624 TaxID=2879629 RepID=UPI001CF21C91|nr:PAAR domain-containing protein [Burkholderia sp. AU31624]MCA8255234.1 PAAR domain-containing protein [Burkholderia sp. AU31624]
MVIFYAVVEDDPLDSGGYVLDGGECGTIVGDDGKRRRITFVGQRAWCSTCESIGTIEAAPGTPNKRRLRDFTSAGRVQALSGDWVRCRCERPPRINSRYGRTWKIAETELDTGIPAAAAAMPGTPATALPTYDDRFVLRDADGNPLSYTGYALRRDTGTFEYGRTDASGQTHLLAATPHAENITIYLAE